MGRGTARRRDRNPSGARGDFPALEELKSPHRLGRDIPTSGRGGASPWRAGTGPDPETAGGQVHFLDERRASPALLGPRLLVRPRRAAAMAEEGPACALRRVSWASALRAAVLLALAGAVLYCYFEHRAPQERLQPPAVSPEGRRGEGRRGHLPGSSGSSGPRPAWRGAGMGRGGPPGPEAAAERPAGAQADGQTDRPNQSDGSKPSSERDLVGKGRQRRRPARGLQAGARPPRVLGPRRCCPGGKPRVGIPGRGRRRRRRWERRTGTDDG